MSDKRYYTVKEVAEKFKVHEDTVNRWRKDERLGSIKLSDKTVRISSDDIEKFEKGESPTAKGRK